MVISPELTLTLSLKFKTILASTDTPVALSAGTDEDRVGFPKLYFGDKVYKTVIPRNVKVSEAPSYGRPVLVYDISCAGSQAYLHLAGEIIRRERTASLS